MPKFYKGVGVGTFLYFKNLRVDGIDPRNPGASDTIDNLMFHIARATTASPYVSLTRSYGVAKDYAINASRTRPTASQPAFVYEIDLPDDGSLMVQDPVSEVAKRNSNPFASPSYHHDGTQSFLLGVVDPGTMGSHLTVPSPQPSAAFGGTPRPPNLTLQLETFVRALRDAEIIVVGAIPPSCVGFRFAER